MKKDVVVTVITDKGTYNSCALNHRSDAAFKELEGVIRNCVSGDLKYLSLETPSGIVLIGKETLMKSVITIDYRE